MSTGTGVAMDVERSHGRVQTSFSVLFPIFIEALETSRSMGESDGTPASPSGEEQYPSECISVGTHFARLVMGCELSKPW